MLDLGWEHTMHGHELPCSMLALFRFSPLQLTTAVGYQITETTKMWIVVTYVVLARELAFQNQPH